VETCPDPAADALDQVWQQEWEENLLSTAFRRLRSKVSSQQLLIFNVAQVYLTRHRVSKLFKAEVQRLRKEAD